MAAAARNTGAHRRAPTNPAGDVPPSYNLDHASADARIISAAAEELGAMILAVEVMMEDQRRLMRDGNAGSFLVDNELWSGMAVLLGLARMSAEDIGTDAEAIEIGSMQAGKR